MTGSFLTPRGVPCELQVAINQLNEMPTVACATSKDSLQTRSFSYICALLVLTLGVPSSQEGHLIAKTPAGAPSQQEIGRTQQSAEKQGDKPSLNLESTEDWNRRLRERSASTNPMRSSNLREYAIGPEDVLDISVVEGQEMNREVPVSASGEISLPLLGAVRAAGLTPRELETALEEALRQKYMRDPHVSVFVHEMQSHPVSVLGAVRKPGVFQVRGSKPLLEILSLAEGLADDAGETAIIVRGAGLQNSTSSDAQIVSHARENARDENATAADPAKNGGPSENIVQVNLKDLLDSSDFQQNPIVSPGDIVKVLRAGIVYVVGEVQRPGGFVMKSNEKMSVLQVIALGGGSCSRSL